MIPTLTDPWAADLGGGTRGRGERRGNRANSSCPTDVEMSRISPATTRARPASLEIARDRLVEARERAYMMFRVSPRGEVGGEKRTARSSRVIDFHCSLAFLFNSTLSIQSCFARCIHPLIRMIPQICVPGLSDQSCVGVLSSARTSYPSCVLDSRDTS